MNNLDGHLYKNIKPPLIYDIFTWLECVVVALLCFVFVTIFLGRITGVDGSSMYPTLEDGDKVVVSNFAVSVQRGDVIIFTSEYFHSPLVKRVIATEGQTVDIIPQTGQVIVDNEVVEEKYINDEPARLLYDMDFPATVPEGCLFVMGDNRNYSTDSRSSRVGMVDARNVIGRVYVIITPLGHFGKVD